MTAVTPDETTAFPAAGLERRFYAFAIDRVIAWTLFAAAGVGAWALFFRHGEVLPGVLLIVGVVLLVSLIFAVLLGAAGRSPGKAAMGLRLVHHGTGTPPGVGPALLRTLVLGVATIPTLGLGLATLAWTAMMDPSRMRRGWHDHVSKAVVVDMRPRQVAEEATDSQPRHVVNLTAMRLVPAAPAETATPAPSRRTPTPAPRPPSEPAQAAPIPPAPTPVRQAPPQAPPPRQPAQAPEPSAPMSSAPMPSGPMPSGPARPPAPDSGRTVVRSGAPAPPPATATAPVSRWRVTFDDGQSFIVEGLGIIGRRPEARPGEPVRHSVPLQSNDMSVSKTHAQIQLTPDGGMLVMDRGSTNGSTLVRQGVSKQLGAGRPATLLDGDVVKFGDRRMTVSRER